MIKKVSITAAFLALVCTHIFAQKLIIGTFNLRYENNPEINTALLN